MGMGAVDWFVDGEGDVDGTLVDVEGIGGLKLFD